MKMNDKDGLHMDRTQNCAECEYMKKFDYGKKIYYCDHEEGEEGSGTGGSGRLREQKRGYLIRRPAAEGCHRKGRGQRASDSSA